MSDASSECWPKPQGFTAGIGPWWCGNCGGCHGWECPYGSGSTEKERMERDRTAGSGPFYYGPYPGGTVKAGRAPLKDQST